MKTILLRCIFFIFLVGFFASCQDNKSEDMSYEELQQELLKVKNMLENNAKIAKVEFEGNQMVLTFADGGVFRTAVPQAIIPVIGTNGNWFVNGADLGVLAETKIPTIGTNGNWWIGDKDTGVKAQGDKGDKGEAGKGIKTIEYDQTTGILKIVLTDDTAFEYTLVVSDGNLGGNLITDLNGAYVLKAINSGDLPFAKFGYDDHNRLVEAGYFVNVLNTPEKWIGLSQEFGGDGRIQKQILREYADVEKAVPVGGLFPGEVDQYRSEVTTTAEELYDEFFPTGIQGYLGTKVDLIHGIFEYGSSRWFYNENYAYRIYDSGSSDGTYSMRKISRECCRMEEDNEHFAFVKEEENVFFYTSGYYGDNYGDKKPEYAYNENNWQFNPTLSTCEDLSSIEIGRYDVRFSVRQQFRIIYYQKLPAVAYTDQIDEIKGKELLDYFVPAADKTMTGLGVTGKYKALFCKFNLYNKGDEMQQAAFNYVYDGESYEVSHEGVTIGNIVMKDGKMQKVVVVENGKQVDVLAFRYHGDLLDVIDAPYVEATDVAKVLYDSKNNPVEFQVNSSKLKGKGYEDILCRLGLAYKHSYYDKDKGCVVEGYIYTEKYTPLLKISYNYNLKNFMNHTLLAAHPIFSAMKFNNAISEMGWAGHGSCFFSEYLDYNEGGYPQRVKGILQYGLLPQADEDMNGQWEYPVNGSVAVMYKLEYEKKK